MAIDPSLLDVVMDEHDGYPADLAAEDTYDALWEACGSASREFPKEYWVEPSQWAEVSAYNDANKLWPIDFVNRFTNQSPTHECVCHALTKVAECAWNRATALVIGPPVPKQPLVPRQFGYSVWFSALSIYSEANPRKWGGSNTRNALQIATKRGFLPDKLQPRKYNFKHSLAGTNGKGCITQSSGDWVPVSKFPEGWEETAINFRPLEVIFPETWEQIVCLVLNGIAVGVGRSGHSIPYMRWVNDDEAMEYPDSYEVFRYDSKRMVKSAVGGAYAIVNMTVPDDWTTFLSA